MYIAQPPLLNFRLKGLHLELRLSLIMDAQALDAEIELPGVWETKESLVITNQHLRCSATFTPNVLKKVDCTYYFMLECWRSRGVYSIMTAKLPISNESGGSVRGADITLHFCRRLQPASGDSAMKLFEHQ